VTTSDVTQLPILPIFELPAHKVEYASPLRYPGGKQKLGEFLRRCVIAADDPALTYVEPYAGGAGAGLSLLCSGDVARIVVNDLDPAIYSFWYAATHYNADLIERVRDVDVSIDAWLEQREIYRLGDVSDPVALGFATLFLNRTSRSGVMGAGVIGGYRQSGRYKVGARFYRQTIIDRLSAIGQLSSRIEVLNRDGIDLITERAQDDRYLFYIDPPYYEKGASLYLNAFTPEDHMALAACLNARADTKWILTYDCVPEIVNAYADRRRCAFGLRYSAHRTEMAYELMVASDAVSVPGLPRA